MATGYGSIGKTDYRTVTNLGQDTKSDSKGDKEKTDRRRRESTTLTICGTISEDNQPRYTRLASELENEEVHSSDEQAKSSQHCHVSDDVTPTIDKRARCKLITASALCLGFMTAEIVGGVLANSLAIATDAAHLLTDFASFMISLFAIFLASRPATKRMSFGWHRAEVMGALISVLMIWVVTGVLVYMAVERVISREYEINATIMLIISSIGIVFNLIMLFTLHDTHGHSHGGHGHSHGTNRNHHHNNNSGHHSNDSLNKQNSNGVKYNNIKDDEVALLGPDPESATSSKGSNINVRAAYIHVLGDLLQSAGVLVAALVIYFKPEYKIADPICTFIFSILVLFTTINILRDTLNVLMEGTPSGVSFSDVKFELSQIPGVLELHNLRLWSLTTSRTAVAVHLAVAKDADHQQILAQAGALLREKFGLHECTVQTEQFVDEMKDCTQCQDPQD